MKNHPPPLMTTHRICNVPLGNLHQFEKCNDPGQKSVGKMLKLSVQADTKMKHEWMDHSSVISPFYDYQQYRLMFDSECLEKKYTGEWCTI